MQDSAKRDKKAVPNLGEFLVFLTLSAKGWEALGISILKESLVRNTRWVLKDRPHLIDILAKSGNILEPPELDEWLQSSITSKRVLMFQVAFLRLIGRPAGTSGPGDVLSSYNRMYGRPSEEQKQAIFDVSKRIMSVNTWSGFFSALGLPQPNLQQFQGILKTAIEESAARGYHGRSPVR